MEEAILELELALDDDGFLDRQCPEGRCRRYFKVLYSDWEKSETVVATCPFCGHKDEPTEFNTVEQEDYLRQVGEAYAAELLQQMLGQLSKSLRKTTGMVRVDVSTKFADMPVAITPDAVESMKLQIVCDSCGSTYAVVGSGFYCPLCGENSAPHSFHQAIAGIRSAVDVAGKLSEIVADRDVAEATRTSLLEDQVENLVTSFQRLADATYPRLPRAKELGRSPFQRLEQGSEVWAEAGGTGFTDIVADNEWSELLTFFQQRHVIGHGDGFVDAEYIRKTGDRSSPEGSRLIISAANVLRMAQLVEKLGGGIIGDLPEPRTDIETTGSHTARVPFPPQPPGTDEIDWQVFEILCHAAVKKDHDNLWSDEVKPRVEELELQEPAVIDSLEILDGKGLVALSHTMGSKFPRHIRLTRRGLELFYSHSQHDYKQLRLKIRDLLVEAESVSGTIADAMAVPILLVHTILREFEARSLVSLHWNGGVAVIHVKSSAQLKRLT